MSTPSTTPANAIEIQGQVGLTVPLAGFLRVVNPGPETNFLDIPTDKILSPSPFHKPPATVPVLVGPVHPGAGSPPGLVDHNGKPLQVKTVSGQITQLSGSTGDGTTYTLTLNTLPKALPPAGSCRYDAGRQGGGFFKDGCGGCVWVILGRAGRQRRFLYI
jgi:hypothetical protein